MSSPAYVEARSSVCHVIAEMNGSADGGLVRATVQHVHVQAEAWLPAISAYLRRPCPTVVISLRPGPAVSRTRGTRVLLPFDPSAPSPEEALSRVNAGLAHELVHAVAGRLASNLMNEGLAVHVDATLQLGGPAWPFGGLQPDRWVAGFVADGSFVSLDELLAGTRRSPEAPARRVVLLQLARYYLEAGSLAGFLIRHWGIEGFLSSCSAGPPLDECDGVETLERRWLDRIGGPPSAAERERMQSSATAWADRHPSVAQQGHPARAAEGR